MATSSDLKSRASGPKTWDPYKLVDISIEEQRAIKERSQMREVLKMEWQKKVTNPYRGAGGVIFDPAVQRFMSMRASEFDSFKATPKTFAFTFFTLVFPVGFMSWYIYRERQEKEKRWRSGQVAYKDRDWKFV